MKHLFYLLIAIYFIGCSAPTQELTSQERVLEIQWIIAKIEHNYAPLNYKQEKLGLNWEQTKKEYLEAASKEQSNNEFLILSQRLVGLLEDGHVSLSVLWNTLPGLMEVAHIGVEGSRLSQDGYDGLYVEKLLPTSVLTTQYPLVVGDYIVEINGQSLYDYFKQMCTPTIGQVESEKTIYAQTAVFLFSSTCQIPDEDFVDIKLIRAGQKMNLRLPWLKRDYFYFLEEQFLASQKTTTPNNDEQPTTEKENMIPAHPFEWEIDEFLNKLVATAESRKILDLANDFQVRQFTAQNLLNPIKRYQASLENDKETDKVIEALNPVTGKKLDPINTEIKEIILNKEGFKSSLFLFKDYRVGYLKIPTFSIGDAEVTLIEQRVTELETLNIDGLVIDLADNGGGSLVHGQKLANLFKPIDSTHPLIEVRLSDEWLSVFQANALLNKNQIEAQYSRLRYETFLKERTDGAWNSSAFSFFEGFTGFTNKGAKKYPIALMINETCASMCDIFAADLVDSGVAHTIGSQSMGAGGNVRPHLGSPRMAFALSLTESLVVRTTGEYIENNGILAEREYVRSVVDILDNDFEFKRAAVQFAIEHKQTPDEPVSELD